MSLLVTRLEIPFHWFPHALICPTNNLLDNTGGNERAIITSVVSFLYGYGQQSKICVCFATKAMWHKRISEYGEVFYKMRRYVPACMLLIVTGKLNLSLFFVMFNYRQTWLISSLICIWTRLQENVLMDYTNCCMLKKLMAVALVSVVNRGVGGGGGGRRGG